MNNDIKEILQDLKDSSENKYINPFELTDDSCKILLDYITNLQQRCEYLERSNNRREDEIMSLRNECVDGETYKSRNEKAIEYIEHENFIRILLGFSENRYLKNIQKELLNILNGGDNNE